MSVEKSPASTVPSHLSPLTSHLYPLPPRLSLLCLMILSWSFTYGNLMTKALRPLTIGLTLLAVGCAENRETGKLSEGRSKVPVGERKVIKTTAYTGSESGQRSHSVKNAIGSRLQSGRMNSAAAD